MKREEKYFRPDFGQKLVKSRRFAEVKWVDFGLSGLKIARLYWLESY